MDGGTVCRTYHHYLRICIQLGTEQYTVCRFRRRFGFDHAVVGGIITALTLTIIFGGVQRIAKVSSIIVPIMALGYIALALIIVLLNIKELPGVLALIVGHPSDGSRLWEGVSAWR